MKSLGILGGTSWHSTVDYYRHINQRVNERLGDKTNPPLIVYTMNQEQIHRLQEAGRWKEIAGIYIDAGKRLIAAGAEGLMFAANTPHRAFEDVTAALSVPFLHIADATGQAIRRDGLSTVGLLGTRFTMEEDFISGRLRKDFGIRSLVPDETGRLRIHRMIFDELCHGDFNEGARQLLRDQIEALRGRGAEGVILGCTELPMLLPEAREIPTFDTLRLHAEMAVAFILD